METRQGLAVVRDQAEGGDAFQRHVGWHGWRTGSRCNCTVIRRQGSSPTVLERWPFLSSTSAHA